MLILNTKNSIEPDSKQALISYYQRIRARSEEICSPLCTDDYQLQSALEVSPPKWHLAHVSWFFETFLLQEFIPGYLPYNANYNHLFNSYYQTIGLPHARAERHFLSRPTVEEIYHYRAEIDEKITALILAADSGQIGEISARLILGLHHEQQHQELLFMDIKHNFWRNPLKPAYLKRAAQEQETTSSLTWEHRPQGLAKIGWDSENFAFDNERPRHRTWLEPYQLASRLTTNKEYLGFILDGGYQRPDLWLSDGWAYIQKMQWQAPLYWENFDDAWQEFTLYGVERLDPSAPVSHISYYEADAFARWAGKRLPSEAELETRLLELPIEGQFSESGVYHPLAGPGQHYGTLWEWTRSPYAPYPGFKPLPGSMGEYNGKFMCNQMVLRGGSCVTPEDHIRPTYRNFFYPHDRWQFAGIRLADDL